MTPTVPRGSPPRSTESLPDRRRADGGAALASDRPSVARLRLSLESSYLLVGQAGFPLRGGLLASYRFDRLFGLGFHLDSNFTDHLSATARGEAIWPIHRHFHLEGALELGARAFFNQTIGVQGQSQRVQGALFNFGAEVAATVLFTDAIGASLFFRAFYSPSGGLSAVDRVSAISPAQGVQVDSGEILLGLRVNFYPPIAPPHREPETGTARSRRAEAEAEAEAPVPDQRQALQDLQASVTALLESPVASEARGADAQPRPSSSSDASVDHGNESGASSDAAAIDTSTAESRAASSGLSAEAREEILALQREIRGLTESSDALETELNAATQILNDLSEGQETAGAFHIRLDAFYDNLTARPPQLNLPRLTAFLQEFRELIRDNGSVRLLIQSTTESFGEVIASNFQSVRGALTAYQRSLPRQAREGRLSRAELEPALAQLGVIIAELQQLRQRPETVQPPIHQFQLWRLRLDRIRSHIEDLSPRLGDGAAQGLRNNFRRLEASFAALTGSMDEARRNWLATRALHSHYLAFRAARRPEQAMPALEGMLSELRGAPESYRRRRSRNLVTLTNVLAPFVRRYSANPVPAWDRARDKAIEILRWIDPQYQAPEVAAPVRSRGARPRPRTQPIFQFPVSGGEPVE